MREFEIFAFTEQYKGLSLTYDRDGRSITVSFITSTRQQHNRHIVIGEIASEIEGEKKKLLVVYTDARGITAATTRRPRFRLQKRSRISFRAADEDQKFSRDFYGDNAPGRKDNAPGNTGREGHDYPLLFLPTGCRGVTSDGIYEAARKATDEI